MAENKEAGRLLCRESACCVTPKVEGRVLCEEVAGQVAARSFVSTVPNCLVIFSR